MEWSVSQTKDDVTCTCEQIPDSPLVQLHRLFEMWQDAVFSSSTARCSSECMLGLTDATSASVAGGALALNATLCTNDASASAAARSSGYVPLGGSGTLLSANRFARIRSRRRWSSC